MPSSIPLSVVYVKSPRAALLHAESSLSEWPLWLKRAVDIGLSLALLLLLSPLCLAIAVLLKAQGQGGSVFYGGLRVGRHGRLFKCWKFRSMEPDSEHLLHAYLDANPRLRQHWETYRKLPHDPRITTRTARIIRKLSLDELPQLWNVLVGEMSLVGPRPMLEEEKHYFGEYLRLCTSVRPGITGVWQVSGRNNASFGERVRLDCRYVRGWSLREDWRIMLKTPLAVLNPKGAY